MLTQTQRPPRIVTVDGFDVIGIACRTNNSKEASGDGLIGQQWGRFMSEGVLEKIPERAENHTVAVYTDYAKDKDGDYTFILGAKVKPGATAPPGMLKKAIRAGRFAVFTSEKGPAQDVVPATWKRIWEVPKPEPGGDRLYESDFELYDERSADPAHAEMEIFIRIA